MKNTYFKGTVIVFVVLLFNTLPTFADVDISIEIKKLSNCVYVCNVDNNKYFIPVIATKEGLVVVDSTNYPAIAAKVKAKIIEELGRNDFKYLINTHHHHDHTCGNQVFAETTIIGHAYVPEDMKKFTDNVQEFIDYRKGYYGKKGDKRELKLLDELEKNFKVSPPEKTFTDMLTLELGDMNIILYHIGKDGQKSSLYHHTRSDIFVFLPEEKVLCTGDVYYKKEWLQSLAKDKDLEKFNGFFRYCLDKGYEVQTVIFGHDPVISK